MAAVRVRQQHQHQQVQQPITPPSPQPTIIRRKKTNQKFEKTMLIVLIGIIAVLGILVLNKQAAIQTTSMGSLSIINFLWRALFSIIHKNGDITGYR